MTTGEEKYDPKKIEEKWREKWEKDKLYQPDLDKAKKPFYNLMMFPYPSAEGLHVGSVFTFTGVDTYGRFKRMQGYDVFEPMGLDGFGIHSENYALKVGKHPIEQAKISEENFYRQLHSIGNSFDWSRKLETYDPKYYKWTQWIFIQLFKKGLAYRKKAPVNFCPKDLTVLADEQVIDGKCERCGSNVEKRQLEQWFFKITAYADRLLNNISRLNWTEKVKIAQTQWIGKKEGINIKYPIDGKYNFLFLHAFGDNSSEVFWPWLKKQLEEGGNKVTALDLPNTNQPQIEEQIDFVLKNYSFDENTIIIGHSLGCVLSLKLLPKLKIKIRKLIFIAPPLKTEFIDGKRREALEKATDWQFDFKSVREHASEIVVFKDIKDHIVPPSHPETIAKELGGKLVEVVAKGTHFNADTAHEVLEEAIPSVEVFTTRPDTNFGATFIALAPEHPFVASLLRASPQIQDYVEKTKKKTEIERQEEGREKTGVFTGLYAINQLTGFKMPIWISDFVLTGFGTGALVGVPGHDKRDFEFAKKYNLSIKRVVVGSDGDSSPIENIEQVQEEEGKMINSEFLDGMDIHQATEKIMDYMEEKGWGKRVATYHLRDWLISRQRYWGPPIPLVFCENCANRVQNSELRIKNEGERLNPGWFAVEGKDLPVLLPDVEDWRPRGDGVSPLANIESFVKTKCPNCGGKARRETDVSDTFLDSAWYFFRYIATEIDTEASKRERVEKWLPVTMYIGGAEHSVLHLLYSRFITMVFKDLGLIDFEEPYSRFYAHGLVIKEGAKMSKSKGNVINPDDYIAKYGVDVLRAYLRFMGPFDQNADFRDSGIEGMDRFLKRVWKLFSGERVKGEGVSSAEDLRIMHQTIKGVTEDMEGLRFNTVIAKLMTWYNHLSSKKEISKDEAKVFVQLLAPIAPFMAEELWERLKVSNGEREVSKVSKGEFESVHVSKWPEFDEKYLVEDEVTIAVLVNGKVRDTVRAQGIELRDQKTIEQKAGESQNVKAHLENKKIKNVIFVPGKIINFVTE